MSFKKSYISSSHFCIIDIGSYKLRVCAASFLNKKIEILGYKEKRQDVSQFIHNECLNLQGLCSDISDCISYLENEIGETFENVIINYPFGELFVSSKQINYKRKTPSKGMTDGEIETILKSTQKLCLGSLWSDIEKYYGYGQSETQIIFSRVNSLIIDGKAKKKLIGETGEHLKISLANGCIPKEKHTLISQIGSVIGKNISRILPSEYCTAKVLSEKNILIINVGATQTTITIKKNGEVYGISKFAIGMNDLISRISSEQKLSRLEVMDDLGRDDFAQYRDTFLSSWGESIGVTLGELLGERTCPKKVYLGGGGSNNDFLKEYLLNFPYATYGVRHIGTTTFIREDMSSILSHMRNINIDDIAKIPLDIYVLLLETRDILHMEHDLISNSLKSAVKKLGYEGK